MLIRNARFALPLLSAKPTRIASSLDSRSNPAPRDSVMIASALTGGTASALVSFTDLSRNDKYKHIGAVGTATIALGSIGFSSLAAAAISFAGATVAKELVYDLLLQRGTPSLHDVAANLAGASAGFAVLKAAQALQNQRA